MTITGWFKRFFKPRFAVIYPFGFFVLFFCSLDEDSLRKGIGFIIIGILIRLWSNGYAVKNEKLTTCGPYSFVRNPLYLGTFLIALGFVIVLKTQPRWPEAVAGSLFLLAFGAMYYRTIRAEQKMLAAKFKELYLDYCRHVPAIIPCLVPYGKGEKWPFSLQRLIKSKEHTPVFWMCIVLVAFYLKTRLLEHKPMSEMAWTLAGAAISLIILEIALKFNRKRFGF